MNRNIAKQFTTTLSLLDVASDRTHKYKCFHGEDIQLTVNVVGENQRPVDLSNASVKIYFTLDKNINEPVYRQDTGIVVDNLGVITVMLEKSYIRIGNNVLKIVLYDEDQTVFLQPLIISCIDPLIGEAPDLETPDDINVRDEIYDIRRIIGDLQDFDDLARNEHITVGERLDNVDSQLDNIDIKKANKDDVAKISSGTPLFANNVSEMTDNTKNYVNLKDGYIYVFNGEFFEKSTLKYQEIGISDKQISEEKTTFINVYKSVNLCNKDDLCIGGYYTKSSDETITITPDSNYCCLKIKIDTASPYSFTNNGYNVYFTEINSNIVVSRSYGTSTTKIPNIDQYGYPPEMYMYLSFGVKYVDTFMLVKGEELPNNYVPYYNIKRLDKTINIDYSSLINIPSGEKTQIFTVGDGKDYATLTECIRDIKDNHEEKIIYIDGGEYNVFEEMGGKAFVDTIDTSSMTWRDVSDIVPNNTSIIGLGEVVLNFSPTTEEITQPVANYLSCINVIYENFHMENITIICGNCRYAIHDETGGTCQGGKHTYKNVKLYKEATTVGYQQVFGCGFSPRQTLDFEQCVFNSRRYPFSCHNNGSYDIDNAIINARNCIFNTKNTDTQTIMFGNVNGKQVKVSVNLSNCYIKEKVYIKNESTTERPNAFDITLLNCTGLSNVEVTCATNIYEPKIFT